MQGAGAGRSQVAVLGKQGEQGAEAGCREAVKGGCQVSKGEQGTRAGSSQGVVPGTHWARLQKFSYLLFVFLFRISHSAQIV